MSSYPCDEKNCKNTLSWYINETGLKIASTLVAVTAEEFGNKLNNQLELHKIPFQVKTPAPKIHNLCATHWLKKAEEWIDDEAPGTSPEGYKVVRAKTTAEGVFFQNNNEAFLHNEANPDENRRPETIISCFVHEIMHFWSHNHKGLQGKGEPFNWDEAICDCIAYSVYKDVLRKKKLPSGDTFAWYTTPYGIHTVWLDKGRESWRNQVNKPLWWKAFKNDSDRRSHLPKTLQNYFVMAESTADVRHGDETQYMWQIALRKMLWTWFFEGPDNKPIEGYNDMEAFCVRETRDDVFCAKFATIFPTIKETSHAI